MPIISGADGIDPYVNDVPIEDPNLIDIKQLKFASFAGNGIDPLADNVERTLQNVVNSFVSQKIPVSQFPTDVIAESLNVWLGVVSLDKGYTDKQITSRAGTDKYSYDRDWTRKSLLEIQNETVSPKRINEVFERWSTFNSKLTSLFHNFDILLCPASPHTAPLHEQTDGLQTICSYNCMSNLTGWPAAVVPVAQAKNGLPIGIQIIGKPWQEGKVLAVAKYIENHFGGYHPPIL